jgi:hypothetical protein
MCWSSMIHVRRVGVTHTSSNLSILITAAAIVFEFHHEFCSNLKQRSLEALLIARTLIVPEADKRVEVPEPPGVLSNSDLRLLISPVAIRSLSGIQFHTTAGFLEAMPLRKDVIVYNMKTKAMTRHSGGMPVGIQKLPSGIVQYMTANSKLQPCTFRVKGVERVGLLVTCDFDTLPELWKRSYFLPRMPRLMSTWSKKNYGPDSHDLHKLMLVDRRMVTQLYEKADARKVGHAELNIQLSLLCTVMDEFCNFGVGGNFTDEFKLKMDTATTELGIPAHE